MTRSTLAVMMQCIYDQTDTTGSVYMSAICSLSMQDYSLLQTVDTYRSHTWMSWHGRGFTRYFLYECLQSTDRFKWTAFNVRKVKHSSEQKRWSSARAWNRIIRALSAVLEVSQHADSKTYLLCEW